MLAAAVGLTFTAAWVVVLRRRWRSREPYAELGSLLKGVFGERVGKRLQRAAIAILLGGASLTLVLVAVAARVLGLISESKQPIVVMLGSWAFVGSILLTATIAIAQRPRTLVPPGLRTRQKAARPR